MSRTPSTKVSPSARAGLLTTASVLGLLGAGLALAACGPEYSIVDAECPPIEDFRHVSPLLESRCGTLDCHGSVSRPLKIYGQYGLRLNPDGTDDVYSGNLARPTTDVELEANFRSVCGLEPEKTTLVARGELEPSELTIVRKPRLAERHKGGRVWDQGKVPDRCLVAWLEADYEPGQMDPSDCQAATQQ